MNNGFTLVETLIAILVLTLAIVGPLTLVRNSLNSSLNTKDNVTAYNLARDGLEYIKNVRDTNLLNSAGWLTGLGECVGNACIVDTSKTVATIDDALSVCSGACDLLRYDPVSHRFGYTSSWDESDYIRTLKITQLNPHEAVISSKVEWKRNNVPYTYELDQNIFSLVTSTTTSAASGCPLGRDESVNLIMNGSFEEPQVTSASNYDIFFLSETPDLVWAAGWEPQTLAYDDWGGVPRPDEAGLELQLAPWGIVPADQYQYAELDGDWTHSPGPSAPASSHISQTVTTIPGQLYELTYEFAPWPGLGPDDNKLLIRINGTQVDQRTADGMGDLSWHEYTWDIVGTGSDTIEFADGGTASSLGTLLDNVRLYKCN